MPYKMANTSAYKQVHMFFELSLCKLQHIEEHNLACIAGHKLIEQELKWQSIAGHMPPYTLDGIVVDKVGFEKHKQGYRLAYKQNHIV